MIKTGDKYKYALLDLLNDKSKIVSNVKCDICGDYEHDHMIAMIVDNEVYYVGVECIEELEICKNCQEFITRANNSKCDGCGEYIHSGSEYERGEGYYCEECEEKLRELEEPMFPDDCI